MVKAQFMTTMPGFKVKSIKRVQNPGLWEDYQRYVKKGGSFVFTVYLGGNV